MPKQIQPEQFSKEVNVMQATLTTCNPLRSKSLPLLTALLVALASAVVLTLAGCASSAGIESSAKPIAPASVGLNEGAAGAAVSPLATDWWQSFGDSELNALVVKALEGSPNLKAAQARLARAQANIDSTRSADGLQVTGALDALRQRFSENGTVPPPLGGSVRTLASAQANASWEFDFFGRNRAALETALGGERASHADVQAARVLLASNVSRAYVQLARLIEQRAVATRTLAQRDEILALIRQRVDAGLDTKVELRQGEGALPEVRQQIEALDEQITLARHSLAALTAQAPNALDALSPQLAVVRAVPIPAAVPVDLLGRRADINAARWRVEAATQDVRAARAQFYPNVSLTAFAGLSSIGLDELLKSGSSQWGIGPAVRLPIFDSGRLRANLRGKSAELDLAVETYNGAVLDAVRDVADQISSLQSIDRQQHEQTQAQASAESAYDLAVQRYKAGLGTYVTVLNAEAGVLAQRRLATDLKARALDTQLALIRSLGGGYVADPAAQASTQMSNQTSTRTAGVPIGAARP